MAVRKVAFPELHHPWFVLPEGDKFGDETKTLFNLFATLCNPKPAQPNQPPPAAIPGIVILTGGKDISRKEVLCAVRGKYQIIVIKGSGGLADTIASAWENLATQKPADPEIFQILEEGNLQFHSMSDPTKGITRLIIRSLGKDKVLTQAWQTFARFDDNAGRMQKAANCFQIWIILVGFLATLLAVIRQLLTPHVTAAVAAAANVAVAPKPAPTPAAGPASGSFPTFLATGYIYYDILSILLILLPIVITLLLSAQSRFKPANKWLLLRAAAEMLKQEIYRYRTRIRLFGSTAQADLAKRLTEITNNVMSTEVNTMSVSDYPDNLPLPPGMEAAKDGDDGFSMLTPEEYIRIRVGDQLSYFRKKIPKLNSQYAKLTWMILGISGGATLLSAFNLSVWLTVTTAAVTALGTYLAYRQTDATRTKYNQTKINLEGIKVWWNALSHEQQSAQENIDMLVNHTEQTLQAELDGWVQQMRNAIDRLTKDLPTTDNKPAAVATPVKPAAPDKPTTPTTPATAAADGKPTL